VTGRKEVLQVKNIKRKIPKKIPCPKYYSGQGIMVSSIVFAIGWR
jgi:hypothetical protein